MKLIHLSAAMSLDGHIDDNSPDRLLLYTPEDFRDLYALRAQYDAILVGANTIRKDNPSLLSHFPELVIERLKRKQTPEPIKVTITQTGNLDVNLKFFTKGDTERFVICPSASLPIVSKKLSEVSRILPVETVNALNIVQALESVGIQSLFVEGGTSILTMFLAQGVFHRLRLAIAPFFVGDITAPLFVSGAKFKNNANNRLRIVETRNLGNMAVLDIINDGYTHG